MWKFCRRCHKRKSPDAFGRRQRGTDILTSYCKECQRKYCHEHYQTHRARHNERRYANQVVYRRRNRATVDAYLFSHPCVDCGESDPIVLEFDHVRGTKRVEISRLIHLATAATLEAEIAKCDVRCANRHRRKTFKELWAGSRIRGSDGR